MATNCRWCGAEMADTATTCPACRQPRNLPPPPTSNDPIDRIVADATRATRDLADATERLTRKAAHEALRAANDPSEAARRALKRFQKEIDAARQDLERLLRELE
jgi:hypothetical protein